MSALVAIGWRARAAPLAPAAVAAEGAAAKRLALRVLARSDEALAKLAGVAGPGVLLFTGANAELPWVDGAIYLGVERDAPGLLLPCNREADVPAALLEKALTRRAGDHAAPLAVLLTETSPKLIAAGLARALSREALTRWLEAQP